MKKDSENGQQFLSGYLKFTYWWWAKVYDLLIDPIFSFRRRQAISQLKIKQSDTIIELGVGTGLNLPHYPQGCKVVGIDMSKAMLKYAITKTSNAQVTLHIADARALPWADNSFEKGLATYVLRVSPQPKKILQELSRVVRRDGIAVVVDQFQGRHTFLLSLIEPVKILLGWGKEYELRNLLSQTPWHIVKNKRWGRMGSTRLVVLKNKKDH